MFLEAESYALGSQKLCSWKPKAMFLEGKRMPLGRKTLSVETNQDTTESCWLKISGQLVKRDGNHMANGTILQCKTAFSVFVPSAKSFPLRMLRWCICSCVLLDADYPKCQAHGHRWQNRDTAHSDDGCSRHSLQFQNHAYTRASLPDHDNTGAN